MVYYLCWISEDVILHVVHLVVTILACLRVLRVEIILHYHMSIMRLLLGVSSWRWLLVHLKMCVHSIWWRSMWVILHLILNNYRLRSIALQNWSTLRVNWNKHELLLMLSVHLGWWMVLGHLLLIHIHHWIVSKSWVLHWRNHNWLHLSVIKLINLRMARWSNHAIILRLVLWELKLLLSNTRKVLRIHILRFMWTLEWTLVLLMTHAWTLLLWCVNLVLRHSWKSWRWEVLSYLRLIKDCSLLCFNLSLEFIKHVLRYFWFIRPCIEVTNESVNFILQLLNIGKIPAWLWLELHIVSHWFIIIVIYENAVLLFLILFFF